MATTKKHFERAAALIKRLADAAGPFAAEQAEAAFAVCVDLFQSDNPRFNVERFRLVCGLRVGAK